MTRKLLQGAPRDKRPATYASNRDLFGGMRESSVRSEIARAVAACLRDNSIWSDIHLPPVELLTGPSVRKELQTQKMEGIRIEYFPGN